MKLPTRRSLVLSIFLLGSILTLHAAAPDITLPTWHTGPRGDLAFITSGFMATTAYRKPDSVDTDFARDGAYGPLNRAWDARQGDRWLIEEQRYASDAVFAGLLTHRQDLIDRGEHIFDWGFRQEQPDGGFHCPDRFHSASFFIEAGSLVS